MTGFKPIVCRMKFVIVRFESLTTIGHVEGLTITWTFNRVKVTTIDLIFFDILKLCLTQ